MAPASCIETGLRRGGRGGLRPRRWYTWQPCQIDRALHDSSPLRASEHGAGERRAGAGCGRVGGAEGGASLSGDGAGALDDIGPQCVVSCGMHARVVCQLRAGGVGALKLLPMMLLIKLKLPLTFICFCLAFFAFLGFGPWAPAHTRHPNLPKVYIKQSVTSTPFLRLVFRVRSLFETKARRIRKRVR